MGGWGVKKRRVMNEHAVTGARAYGDKLENVQCPRGFATAELDNKQRWPRTQIRRLELQSSVLFW